MLLRSTLGRGSTIPHKSAPTKWGCWSYAWLSLRAGCRLATLHRTERVFVCFVFVVFIWSSILFISFISSSHVMHTQPQAVAVLRDRSSAAMNFSYAAALEQSGRVYCALSLLLVQIIWKLARSLMKTTLTKL